VAAYSRRGLHGQVVQELASRIFSGRLLPGERFDLPALEAELDVSRTVLRESLKVLAAKGLVDARQKRGTFIRPASDWNLLDADVIRWQFAGSHDGALLDELSEVRAVIEPTGARLAARRRTEADLAVLQDALDRMRAARGDPAAAVTADLAFHRALLAATHNRLLQRMELVVEAALAERDRIVHGSQRADDPVPSHQAVFDAVSDRDVDKAEQAMWALLEKATNDLDLIRRGPRPTADPEGAGA
jgi:GntR family transcriptional regulator, galactonate operon transcriptional repressor